MTREIAANHQNILYIWILYRMYIILIRLNDPNINHVRYDVDGERNSNEKSQIIE